MKRAIANPALTVLLLSGSDEVVREVHGVAQGEERETPTRRVFLITEPSELKPEEQAQWFAVPNRFVVIGGRPRAIVMKGALDELCRKDGKASIRQIIRAFSAGDRA